MRQYDRIDSFEAIDINKTEKSKVCMICHYRYFKDIGYKYEPYVCNQCHDSLMVVCDLKNSMILNIKGFDYRCYVFNLSKNDAINLLNNSCLDNKGIF